RRSAIKIGDQRQVTGLGQRGGLVGHGGGDVGDRRPDKDRSAGRACRARKVAGQMDFTVLVENRFERGHVVSSVAKAAATSAWARASSARSASSLSMP